MEKLRKLQSFRRYDVKFCASKICNSLDCKNEPLGFYFSKNIQEDINSKQKCKMHIIYFERENNILNVITM